jgi:hypothetical protein
MMFLLLTLLGAVHFAPEGPQADTARGIEFDRVQTEWVVEATHPHDFDQVLPPRATLLLRVLGSPDYNARMLATADLHEMGDKAIPVLLWGQRSKVPAIHNACFAILRKFFRCPVCDGGGCCQMCLDDETNACPHAGFDSYGFCFECAGTGDIRFVAGYDSVIVDRNLFGETAVGN